MMELFWLGGDSPGEIPGLVYLHLIKTIQVPADKLAGLRSVQKEGFGEGKAVTFIRIYNPNAGEEAWHVKNFASLDNYPHLILYEGYWEKSGDSVFLTGNMEPKSKATV